MRGPTHRARELELEHQEQKMRLAARHQAEAEEMRRAHIKQASVAAERRGEARRRADLALAKSRAQTSVELESGLRAAGEQLEAANARGAEPGGHHDLPEDHVCLRIASVLRRLEELRAMSSVPEHCEAQGHA